MIKTISRRRLSILMLSVMCTVLASGQARIGVHAGVNLSDVTEPPNYDHAGTWEMQSYGFGGIVADFHFAEHWQLAAEVNFIQKGIRIPLNAWGLSYPGSVTLTANYFEVPLKIRFRSGGESFGWYVEGGSSMALRESGRARMVTERLAGLPYIDETSSVAGIYRTFQPSLVAGAGAEYELTGALTLVLSASYDLGLSDVYDDFWSDTRSRGGQCALGLLVSL